MNYRVGWVPDTYIELAYIWALAPDPAAVRLASRAIELELATDPELKGRHLAEGLWKLVRPLLVVHYTIDPDRREVWITDVFPTPHPTP